MAYKDAAVLITGGSKGVGLSIAKVFARETNRPIILMARNKEDLNKAKELCLKGGATSVHTIAADITDEKQLQDSGISDHEIGILVNNAGHFLYKRTQDTTTEEFRSQLEVNTIGAFNVTQAVLPSLYKLDRGLIVNISSMGALKGLEGSGAYSASKHALLGYTRSLHKELMKSNIAVSAINLGQTDSTSWDGVDIDPQKLIDPDDVGRLILSVSQLSKRSVVEEIILMPQGGEVPPM
ncbi:SDR family NAD(P)-dependent oxidoreductase [Gracilimonas amylolytica]|uniref:SDR family NAD(P)-dependent oxidoreductase n=1 Tax=Gracilimonas amylolytica TaxID=1749045 RepID=UPI000CD817EB|nr:SDR family oxidoreductase [Gracilimonas amylolytica]